MTLEKYDDGTAAKFGKAFIKQIEKYPLGGMSKRDLDCLIFYLLKENKLIPGKMNREKAYNLNISESKFKGLLVDSDAKFVDKREESKVEESVKKMFDRLANGDNNVSLEGDTLVFIEEDSIVKDDFAYAMKKAGFYTDTSFNSEIIKVKAAGFLAFARATGRLSDKQIYALLGKNEADEKNVEAFKDANKTGKEMMQDMLNILKKQDKFGIKTFFELFSRAGDIISAKHNGGRAQR